MRLSLHIYLKLAFEQVRAHKLFYFYGKKLIICIYYNLGLLHFSIKKKKKPRGVIYILICLFFLLLLGLTHYFSVCVLSGALSSSYYFCLLVFLHLSLTLYFFFFCYRVTLLEKHSLYCIQNICSRKLMDLLYSQLITWTM